ncbi:MBL fold metallo-hydrolase [Phytoactinopolyspora halotolerans]|uniref:MBL fold metallo-hydrolase n=1 Tax=Phytoactinopolyspora halotolerans TaxID=1981512 RepID=A0A6L9SBC8_9ACTN|nr:MBL fold metallo-hydrolase [Phytoactinopolyspora halotolerans]NEE01320.1 MBL fold metallo-hydrolase [Phytoactinopolyspora halotolerans]
MQLLSFPSPVLGTNCYILAREGGDQCVVIDPGIGVDAQLVELLEERALRPAAALVTHGHVDHTYGLAGLCRRWEIPVYIHGADEYRLDDPIGTLGPELASALGALADDWSRPSDVRPLTGDEDLELAGVSVRVMHAPGHTEGSTLYSVDPPYPAPAPGDGAAAPLDQNAAEPPWLFTGDVLFAGTIGRTDLPGGDTEVMQRTLRWLATPESAGGLPDAMAVLPGHGEGDSLGRQRSVNPFLRDL